MLKGEEEEEEEEAVGVDDTLIMVRSNYLVFHTLK